MEQEEKNALTETENIVKKEEKPTYDRMYGFGRSLTSTIMGVLACVCAVITVILCYGFAHVGDSADTGDYGNGAFGYEIKTSGSTSENAVKQAVDDAIFYKCGCELNVGVYEDDKEHDGFKIFYANIYYPKDEQKREEVRSMRSEIAAKIAQYLNIEAENVKITSGSNSGAIVVGFALAFAYGFAYMVLLIWILIFGINALAFAIVGLSLGIVGIKGALKAKQAGVLPVAPFVLSIVGTSLSGVSLLLLLIGFLVMKFVK